MRFDGKRRNLLYWSLLGGLSHTASFFTGRYGSLNHSKLNKSTNRELLVLGHTQVKLEPDLLKCTPYTRPNPGKIVLYDPILCQKEEIPVPLFPHGFAINKHHQLLATSQKYGDLAAIVDLKSRRVIKYISSPKNSTFFGHCCYSGKNKEFLAFSATHENGQGQLLIYDSHSHQYIKEIRFPRRIHDIQSIGKEIIQVAVAGRVLPKCEHRGDNYQENYGAIQQVNFYTEDLGPFFSVSDGGHILALEPNRYLVLGTRYGDSPVSISIVNVQNKIVSTINQAMTESGFDLTGEALSACQISENTVAITLPDQNKIVVWNFHKNFLATTNTPGPVNGIISIKKNHFITNLGSGLLEYRFDTNSRAIEYLRTIAINIGNGRHIYRFPILT